MLPPPATLDGAAVLFWAASEPQPFFHMPAGEERPIPIHGLAICRFPTGEVYRFSCDASWEVQNDSTWPSVETAMRGPSAQFDVSKVKWVKA